MAVHIKCSRPYNIEALKAIIERCGGRGPSPPRCPPMGQAADSSRRQSVFYSSDSPCSPSAPSACRKPSVPRASPGRCCTPRPSCSGLRMACLARVPVPPCPPCPFVCSTCTGYPCVNSAPLPKPVPAPYETPRPVVRTLMNSGGLFYTGTRVCCPCPPPISTPRCLPFTPIPGMSVSC